MSESPKVAQKAILIREDGMILSIRRSKTDPNRPLWWDVPGGDVEYGEDLTAAIKREVREEVGISLENLTLLDVIGFTIPSGEYWVSIGYYAHVPQDTVVTLSWEHDQFEWITKEEFLTRKTTDRIKRFLRNTNVPMSDSRQTGLGRTESTKYENTNHPTSRLRRGFGGQAILPTKEGRR